MDVRIARRLFTVDEYYRMAAAGILGPDDRVELIDGEIVEMSPIGIRHASCVDRIMALLIRRLGRRATVCGQNPVRLDIRSEPQPDIAVVSPRDDFYASGHPGPSDVLWLVEVADTTLAFDRRVKVPLYARAGVPELWIVDLEHDRVEVFADPAGGGYTASEVYGRGDRISPRALVRVTLRVEEILG